MKVAEDDLNMPGKEHSTTELADVDLNDRKQRSTPAENLLKQRLINMLISSGYNGDVSHGETIVIPIAQGMKRNAAINNQLKKHSENRPGLKFTVRQADFMIHGLGIVIEVDGEIHNKNHSMKRDERREAEWKCLGYDVLVILNGDVNDSLWVSRLMLELKTLIDERLAKGQGEDKLAYQRRRKCVSRARQALAKLHPSLDLGKFRAGAKEIYDVATGLTATVQFNGRRFDISKLRSQLILHNK